MTRGASGDEQKRLNQELEKLLQELRVILPGVQVLFGFLLILPFNPQFSTITALQRDVYYATLLSSAIAAILLIAPSAHRFLRHHQPDEPELQGAKRLTLVGLSFLAVAITGVVSLVTSVLFGTFSAVVVAVAIGGALVWLWFALPVLRRRH